MGEFFEWLKSTELYKDEKFWQLFCAVIPSLETLVSWIFAIFQYRSRSKQDKENKAQIVELEAKFEKQLKEKDLSISKLKKRNEEYKIQVDAYKSKYGKLRVRG